MRASTWIQQADQAMIRAAARARAVAASTRTSIHIMKDGKIVKILPEKDDPQLSGSILAPTRGGRRYRSSTPGYHL